MTDQTEISQENTSAENLPEGGVMMTQEDLDQIVVDVRAQVEAEIKEQEPKIPTLTVTIDELASRLKLGNIALDDIDVLVFPVIPVLPLRGELDTEFSNDRMDGTRYLNMETHNKFIEQVFHDGLDDNTFEDYATRVMNKVVPFDKLSAYQDMVANKEVYPMAYKQDVQMVGILSETPGGSPSEAEGLSEKIKRESRRSGVPFYTFAENMATSGGQFILSTGNEAYAAPYAMIASIGVVSEIPKLNWLGRLFSRAHLLTITAGDNKRNSLSNPHIKATKEDIAEHEESLRVAHDMFKAYIKQNRGDKLKGDENVLFSGKCLTAHKALEFGLIDGIGHYDDILESKAKSPYTIIAEMNTNPTTGTAMMAIAPQG